MSKLGLAAEKVSLGKFVAEISKVSAPRWVWWLLLALVLVPVSVSLGVKP